MKKLLVIIGFVASVFLCNAQSQMTKLPVHQKYRNFETSTTVSLPAFPNNPYDCGALYYYGQQPFFCEAIGYNCNHKLQFFIIDDKIYNKNGISYNSEYSTPIYLHLNEYYDIDVTGTGNFVNTTISPDDICAEKIYSEEDLNYYPGSEVVIIPVPGHGNQYYIVYSVMKTGYAGSWGASDVYYRKLTYNTSTDNITLTDPVGIVGYAPSSRLNLHLAATPMFDNGEQFLFVNYADSILVYNVNSLYNISTAPVPVESSYVPIDDPEGDDGYREEMEVRLVEEDGEYFYYLAVPFVEWAGTISNKIGLYKYNADDASYVGSKFLTVNTYPVDYKHVKGIELSPDGKKMFYNYQGQTTMQYLDLSFMETLGTVPSPVTFSAPSGEYASDFEKSQIELGYDNALYMINGRTGTLKRFSNPLNPSTGTWSTVSGFSALAISGVYAGVYGTGHYILADQIDGGSNFENYDLSFNLDAGFTKSASCVNNEVKITVNADVVYQRNVWKIQRCSSTGSLIDSVLQEIDTQTDPYVLTSNGTSLIAGAYYKIYHTVEDGFCNVKEDSAVYLVSLKSPGTAFTTELFCLNNQPAIRATSNSSLYVHQWKLYESTSGGTVGTLLQTINGGSTVEFTGLQLDHYYYIRHYVTNCTTEVSGTLVNTYNNLNALFQVTTDPLENRLVASMPSPYVNKVDYPYISFSWNVVEVDASHTPISGTEMANPSNWWGAPFYTQLNFPGYTYPNFNSTITYPAGTFLTGHLYKITRGLWSGCNSWDAKYQIIEMGSKGAIVVEQGESDMEMPSNLEGNYYYPQVMNAGDSDLARNIYIYPLPANNLLFIELSNMNTQDISFELYDVLGNLVLKQNLDADFNSVSLDNFASAVYQYRIMQSGKLVKSDKLIISK